MKFELSTYQKLKLQEWQLDIMTRYGSAGQYTFKFTPTGIGDVVEVYSHLDRTTLDLTNFNDW